MNDYRPIWLIRLYQMFVVLGVLPFLLNTLDILLHPLALMPTGTPLLRLVLGLLIAPLTLWLGILCVRRVPHNIIGWMLLAMAYGISAQAIRLDLLLNSDMLVLIRGHSISLFWSAYILIFLYFPTGKLYPERLNRYGNPLIVAYILFSFLSAMFFSPQLFLTATMYAPNPLFIIEWDYTVVSIPLSTAVLLTGLVTLFARYRYGSFEERRQLRWLLFGFAMQIIPSILLIFFKDKITGTIEGLTGIFTSILYNLITPVAVSNAILRHKLYDIDIIIRRTLIYSVLTGVLAVIYFGGVIVTQQLFQAVTGDTPDIAIVLSTLLIAALFSPLRNRIQDVIDRRLYRRKYDVEQTIAQFNQSLRDEVDVQTLSANLISVVCDTMQPARISLWIAEPAIATTVKGKTSNDRA